MKKILTLFFLLFCTASFAQFNLVPNPSFEVNDTCPNNIAQIYRAIPWTNPHYPTSPDYFNACTINPSISVPANYGGYEPARTGDAYALVATASYPPGFPLFHNYREYLQVELTDTLINNEDYCIRFYVSAIDSANYITNNIGIYFSPIQIQDTGSANLLYSPQFENPLTNNLNSRNGWTLVAGTYTALGGEKFIVIGNFRDTITTLATNTGWTTNPAYDLAAYYIEDVLISPCDSLTGYYENKFLNPEIKLFPSPASNEITIELENDFLEKILIFSITGEIVSEIESKFLLNKTSIDIHALANGIYFISVKTIKNNYNLKFIKS